MRAVVFGAAGRLGRALSRELGERLGFGARRADADVTDAAAVDALISRAKPDVVFNATAYNAVDTAESQVAAALAVNAVGPRYIADAARKAGALVVHLSTNYVFDGTKEGYYDETDPPSPRTVYGISKWTGECLVAAAGEHLVVRTSAVFGDGGGEGKPLSFVSRVVESARQGAPLRIVDDQVVCTTYAVDLARTLVALVERGARGLFHVTNAGAVSWFELARTAVRIAGLRAAIEPVSTAELGAPAPRPRNTPMRSVRLAETGVSPLRPWQDALREFLSR